METLRGALATAPRYDSKGGTLYRGIRGANSEDVEKTFGQGKNVRLEGISSFTKDPEAAKSFTTSQSGTGTAKGDSDVVFHLQGSKQGVDLGGVPKYSEEQEVLLDKGAKFKVDKVVRIDGGQRKQYHVYLKDSK